METSSSGPSANFAANRFFRKKWLIYIALFLSAFLTIANIVRAAGIPQAPTTTAGAFLNAAEMSEGVEFKVSFEGMNPGITSGGLLELLESGVVIFSEPIGEDDVSANAHTFSAISSLGSDGVKSITARVVDESGTGEQSPALNVTVDTVAPVVMTAKLTSPNQVTLVFDKAVLAASTDFTNFVLNAAPATITSLEGSGTATLTLNTEGNYPGNTQGSLEILSTLEDEAGNPAQNASFAIEDGQAPVAPAIQSADQEAQTLGGTAEAGTTVEVFKDGQSAGTVTATAEGTWSFSIAGTNPGTYVFAATSKDLANNVSALSNEFTLVVPDVTAPVITVLGNQNIEIEFGSMENYEDAGATATDNVDGDLTNAIVTVNPVVNPLDPSALYLPYTITYNVQDAAGNKAEEMVRTVVLIDSLPPVITLNGESEMKIELNTAFTDPGATARDVASGNRDVQVSGEVDTATVGTYTLTYTATDAIGNIATATRAVNVVEDATAPVITLIGENPMTVQFGSEYTEQGGTVTDNKDDFVSLFISGEVNTGAVGVYTVTYSATDAAGNTSTTTRTVNVVDTVAPVITLLGSGSITLEFGSEYIDAGATASDNADGDLTGSINTVNPVNTTVLGTYTVTYDVVDLSGNAATSVSRVVEVQDTQAPTLTLLGESSLEIQAGSTYEDAGVTATDNADENISEQVVVENTVNTRVLGEYTVTYNLTDDSGNAAATVVRTVNVIDTTPPVITLLGSSAVTVEYGAGFDDPGVSVTDNLDGVMSINPNSTVTPTNPPAVYVISYIATDSQGNTASKARIVTVVDTTPPAITLNGENPVTLELGSEYTDAGATAVDLLDGDVTENLQVTNPVNTGVAGTYTVTYTVSDAAGNEGTATRTVNIVDSTLPEITILGSNPMTLQLGATFADPGATATDKLDGNLTAAVTVTGTVNTSAAGTYILTYSVTDSSQNTTTATRTVIIQNPPATAGNGGGGSGSGGGGAIIASAPPVVLGSATQKFENGSILVLEGTNRFYLIENGERVRIGAKTWKRKYRKAKPVVIDKATLNSIPLKKKKNPLDSMSSPVSAEPKKPVY